jgi:hypothetical protein
LVGTLSTVAICGSLTGVSSVSSARTEMISSYSEEDEWIVIAPGEGIVIYQDVAATTADTRRVEINMFWDEIDTA